VENLIRMKKNVIIKLNYFDIIPMQVIIVFFLLLYNFLLFWENVNVINKKKWSGSKTKCIHFLEEYSTSLEDIVNKKARKTCNILNEYTVVVVLLINYGLYTLACFEIYSYVNSAYYIV